MCAVNKVSACGSAEGVWKILYIGDGVTMIWTWDRAYIVNITCWLKKTEIKDLIIFCIYLFIYLFIFCLADFVFVTIYIKWSSILRTFYLLFLDDQGTSKSQRCGKNVYFPLTLFWCSCPKWDFEKLTKHCVNHTVPSSTLQILQIWQCKSYSCSIN